MSLHRRHSRFVPVLVAGSLALGGCAPYVRTSGLESSLPAQTTVAGAPSVKFAGDVAQAIADVDAQRNAYLERLQWRTVARNTLSGGLIVLSAASIYKGVVHTTDATKGLLALAGAAGGAAYAVGAYSDSPPTEAAYLMAHRSLTCLVLRTRPWLMDRDEYIGLYGHGLAVLPAQPDHDLQILTPSVAWLHRKINDLDKAYEEAMAAAGEKETLFRQHTRDVSQALYRARETLRKAQHLKAYVDTAGFQLRQEANMVVSLANQDILRQQPALYQPGQGQPWSQLTNVSTAFQNIKPVPLTQDAKDVPEKNVGSGETTTAPPVKTASSAESAKPVPSKASSAAGKAADDVENRLKKAEVKIAALSDAKKKTEEVWKPDAVTQKAMSDLASRKSDLYAAMRPITLVLTRVYSLKPYVRNVAECRAGQEQALKLSPDDDEVALAPGDNYDVTITGGSGYPRVTLGGTVGSATVSTMLADGSAKATIKVPPDMKSGAFSLQVRDGAGTQSDEISFTVKAAETTK